MKKILITLLFPFTLFSQEPIGSYEIFDKEYKISATEPKENGDYSLYVDGYTFDATVSSGGIIVENNKIDDFINGWEQAKEKYIEWTTTAKENNVTDLNKDIKVKIPKLSGYFSYGSWKFDWNVSPYFKYLITESKGKISYGLILYTGTMQASDNEYIDCDSFAYAFYSIEDINKFISLFDQKLVTDHFKKKNSKEDLFKD